MKRPDVSTMRSHLKDARPKGILEWVLVFLALVSLLGLFAIAAMDWSYDGMEGEDFNERTAPYFALHTLTANLLLTALFLLIGFGPWWLAKKHREELLNDSATALGFGGVVRPMLDIAWVMHCVRENAETTAGGSVMAATPLLRTKDDGPLKWVVDLHLKQTWKADMGAADRDPKMLSVEVKKLADECIRQLVGTVRDWADLLVTTDLGRQGAFCLAELRKDLQVFMLNTSDRTKGEQALKDDAKLMSERAARLAVAFELASNPGKVRDDVKWCTQAILQGEEAFKEVEYQDPVDTSEGRALVGQLFIEARTRRDEK